MKFLLTTLKSFKKSIFFHGQFIGHLKLWTGPTRTWRYLTAHNSRNKRDKRIRENAHHSSSQLIKFSKQFTECEVIRNFIQTGGILAFRNYPCMPCVQKRLSFKSDQRKNSKTCIKMSAHITRVTCKIYICIYMIYIYMFIHHIMYDTYISLILACIRPIGISQQE